MAGRRTEVDASSQDGTASLEETKATTDQARVESYTQEVSQPKGEQANSEVADPAVEEEDKEQEAE